jgi:hypothetical protein
VTVRVKPGSAREAVGGDYGDALRVAVTAKPVNGHATEAVLRAIAAAFAVPRSDVTVYSGATGRTEILDISGPPEILKRRLAELRRGA